MRSVLKENCIMRLSERTFRIDKVLGRGSSSVAYYAFDANDGTQHIIKEYNPQNCRLEREPSGQIVCNSADKEEYENGLRRFILAANKQIEIRKNKGLVNQTANIQKIYENENGTAYIDMTYMAGKTFGEIECKSLKELLVKIRTICNLISIYHIDNLLYLDIKPENVYFIEETDEIAFMFDFDSVVSLDEIQEGTPLYYTKSWAAPEQYLCSAKNKISKATDIYAIGEMLFYGLFGRHSENREKCCFSDYPYDESILCRDINPRILNKVTTILRHTICLSPSARYQDVEYFINALDEAIELLGNKVYLKKTPIEANRFFLGREKEISSIMERIPDNRFISLFGIGGIGKTQIVTELAKRLGGMYTVLFASYEGSWIDLIVNKMSNNLANFPYYSGEKPEEKKDYFKQVVFELDRFVNNKVIIIIDNIDADAFSKTNAQFREKILGLDGHFIFTSRDDLTNCLPCAQIEINSIERMEDRIQLFYHWSRFESDNDNKGDVTSLIDYVAGHTLAIEIIAKQCKELFLSPKKMLENLRNRDYGYAEVGVLKDGSRTFGTPEDIITNLFELSDHDKVKKDLLFFMTLMPVSGIKGEILREILSEEENKVLGSLVSGSWLMRNGQFVMMHPLIAESVRRQYKDSTVNSRIHFEKLIDYIDRIDELNISFYSTGLESVITSIYNEYILTKEINDVNAKLFNLKAWSECVDDKQVVEGMYHAAKSFYMRNIEKYSGELLKNSISLAQLYYLYSNFEQAIKELDDAEELAEKYNHREFGLLGDIYNLKGEVFSELQNIEKSYSFYMKAYHLYTDIGTSRCEVLLYSDILSNIGDYYYNNHSDSSAFENAKKYHLESLEMLKSIYPTDNRHSAIRYHNLGKLSISMWFGDKNEKHLEEAETYLLKSKDIRITIYGPNSEHVCTAYNALSELYDFKGMIDLAIDYAEKSVKIYDDTGEKNSLDYSRACIFLAEVLYQNNRISESEEYYNIAIQTVIRLKEDGNVSCEFYEADYTFRLARLFVRFNELEKAEEVLNRAHALFLSNEEYKLYAARDFVLYGLLYERVSEKSKAEGNVDEAEGKKREALSNFKKALSMFPDNESCKRFIDTCKEEIEKLEE